MTEWYALRRLCAELWAATMAYGSTCVRAWMRYEQGCDRDPEACG